MLGGNEGKIYNIEGKFIQLKTDYEIYATYNWVMPIHLINQIV